ncbi:MAG TPA: PAS domain S-box protein [Magnetospirillum sp.]|nr:PAS domain S-box protein [Magnetospirillum sp.]
MHERLAQQLRCATRADGSVDLHQLLCDVERTYQDGDRDCAVSNRAADEVRQEVERLRQSIRAEADARFNVVMDNVGEAVISIGLDGSILTFNRAAEDMFGYQEDDVVGRNVGMLTTDDLHAGLHAALDEFIRTGDAGPLEHIRESQGRRHDGNVFPMHLAVAEVFHGTTRQLVGIIRDTSVQVETERQLRESEGRFRDLVGSASDWFWETDAQHRLTFVSERIAAVMGVKAAELIGSTFFDLGLADAAEAAEAHRAELAAYQPFRDRIFHVGPPEGHDSRVIRISGIPVFDDGGTFTGYRGVGVDITREVMAERRAHRAQQLLADAIDRIVDGVAVYDAQDRLALCNPEYRKIFAGKAAGIIRQGVLFEDVLRSDPSLFDTDGVPFEDWAARRLAHHRAATGEPFVVRLSTGRWILHREFRMADGGIVGLRTDISELKRREQELESLRRLYRVILDTAGEGIVGLDAAGRVTFANRCAADLLGYTSEQMVEREFQSLVQPVGADGVPWPTDAALIGRTRAGRGETAKLSEDRFLLADGTRLAVDCYVSAMDQDGQVGGAVVVFRDATLRLRYEQTLADSHRDLERLVAERTSELTREVLTRARTEQALRDSRERLKGISDNLFEGVLVINRDGLVTFANPSARVLLALGDEPEGQPIDSVVSVRGRGAGTAAVSWLSVLRGEGNYCDNDAVFVTPAGRAVDVAYACTAVQSDGDTRAVVLSFRDISPLKEAQREALQSSRMASVGQLAAGIAHEINTPIQYIGDNLRFISESMASIATAVAAGLASGTPAFSEAMDANDVAYLLDEVPRAVSQSLEGVGQVARIVLSMKEFSHPGSNSKTMADLNRALDSTVTVTRNTWKHVATVSCEFQPDLPPVPCYAGELNQVFLNIIVNAAQAIEAAGRKGEGKIQISTSSRDGYVLIRFADNGTGMPEHVRERIFDPFFTTKEVGKGTGQGLAISRDVVVVKHGGRIDVETRQGEGSVFTVWLPLEPAGDSHQEEGEDEE